MEYLVDECLASISKGGLGRNKKLQSGSLDNSKGSDATANGWNWFADSLATQQAKYPH